MQTREEDERGQGKFPIHVEQNHYHRRTIETGCLKASLLTWLRAACIALGVIGDARHQNAGAHSIKEIHRLTHDLAKAGCECR